MTTPQQRTEFDLHHENPQRPPLRNRETSKSQWEEQNDQARMTFHKTLDGHYRHGKTGYERVACLFITWKDDDQQCKETEVDSLRDTFKNKFSFETDYYEIPSERWETALHKKVSEFVYEYDSPDCLVIIYYGGHGYKGNETGEFKLSAKYAPDGDGDPNVFFNDVLTCLRLPSADQLLIVDCCYAARAFHRHHVGKRKFELFASAGFNDLVPSPGEVGSFTKCFNEVLVRVLSDNPNGFSTSHLYRELYHAIPNESKHRPLHFDQARHSHQKIWLRPQKETNVPKNPSDEEARTQLKLTLQLNEPPNAALMQELAVALQYLPHVEKIRYEHLYAPRKAIEDFMSLIVQSKKIRPLMRKIYAKRMLKKVLEMNETKDVKQPQRVVDMLLRPKQQHYDWSNAVTDDASASNPHIHHRRKSFTFPLVWGEYMTTKKSLLTPLLPNDLKLDFPGRGLLSHFRPRHVNTNDGSLCSHPSHAGEAIYSSTPTMSSPVFAVTSVSFLSWDSHNWSRHRHLDETWHVIMWVSMVFGLGSLCWVMKE